MEPDSISDWVGVGVNAVVAVATVLAVWFSVITARRARVDQQIEAERRREAEAQLLAEQRADAAERLRAAAQLEAVQREADARELREIRNAEVARMAERQAVFVSAKGLWSNPQRGIAGDYHAPLSVVITNESDFAITDVSFRFERTYAVSGVASKPTEMDRLDFSVPTERVEARSALEPRPVTVYTFGHTLGDDLGFSLRFTDRYADRWQLNADGSLHLRAPREISSYDSVSVGENADF